jgi:hypothetical protein
MEKIRSRLISFRVSDEEFRRLKTAAKAQRARCFSEFIRNLATEHVHGFAPAPGSANSAASQLAAFDRRLAQLECNVARIAKAFDGAETTAVRSAR